MIYFTVSKTDTGNDHFPTLSEAIEKIPTDTNEPVTIFLTPGIYHEKITIARPYVTLAGEDAKTTIIAFDDCATQIMPDGSKRGTFRSYTMFLNSHDITLSNLTIRNEAFPRSKAGQALALYADGDRIMLKGCRLESYQDTLFTGPLPPAPLSPGGFTGPKEFDERIVGRQYYKNCYICGDIDFIFGSATAYFEDCEIASVYSETLAPDKDGNTPVYGYATAASTPEGYPYGYVFDRCRFTSTCPDRSVYLGRPWRNFAKTVLINCQLGSHIREEGFHDWNKKEAHGTLFYAEYHSTGEGAAPTKRASFVKQLTDSEVIGYTKESVLSGEDNWNP
ncbi:MAG: pectinesterase family protein [Suilimivivens sp.]